MTLLHHALQGSRSTAPRAAPAPRLLVAGGGGALGSAVLEAALGSRRFSHVRVMTKRGFTVAMNGLEAVIVEEAGLGSASASTSTSTSMATPTASGSRASLSTASPSHSPSLPIADIALVVFDRARHANGRELAFVRPLPEDLLPIARWLHERGVRHLAVVMPHSASGLPGALKAGLANLDEHGASAIGFEHLVFVRSAQQPADARAAQWLQRLADGVIAQMRIMVPAASQPVRAAKVAQFAIELAAQLPASPPGTRVAPPELVWQASQMREPAALVGAWLGGGELPPIQAPKVRM